MLNRVHGLKTGCAHQFVKTMIEAAMIGNSAQQYRALTMIVQSHKTRTMISMMPFLCHIACASKTLSPVHSQQSLYTFLV